ncbi:MAG: TonB-dependent receptor, partial [Saprospiraceae bacterium]|nr:TonB-dependent receptor [Saprospiraceae bacterium]
IVLSKDSQPIVGAHVVVKGSLVAAVTDLDGYFELVNLAPGNYTLQISAVGFKTISQPIEISSAEARQIKIIFEENEIVLPDVTVLGKSDRLFSKTPGSASFINARELDQIQPLSGNEALRRSPGIHVPDEEGIGMRANIGIRGLNPDRSRSLLILEDGIPVALAPYGEPEMYYTPPIDRMSGIEILKGSGQILFGPQTIGGVINYLTKAPPLQSEGKAKIQVGEGGFVNSLLNYGNTFGKTGFNITLLKKRADKVGLTKFDINDLSAKLLLNLTEKSSISMKTGIYHESSNSTYIGITQTMYDQGGQDFTHMAPDDNLDVRRYSLSLNHDYRFNQRIKLKTTAFGYTTTRNWRRQDFSSNANSTDKPSNWTGVTWGDESVPGGAIYMRNSTGNRNRQFEVAGLESQLTISHDFLGFRNQLKTGARYLHEVAHEQRVNGTKYNVDSGDLREDEQRTGEAISAYVQNMTDFNEKISIHYGLRLERFDYRRDIARRPFNIGGTSQIRDTILVKDSQLSQLIPGVGFTWKPMTNLAIYGGIHKGFAPPRTKDAISGSGEVYELDAERSTNYELGLRSIPTPGVRLEVTGFYMDFSNQIIPVSESSGGIGSGLVNGGETMHRGVESAIQLDLSELAGWLESKLEFDLNTTFLNAEFIGDRTKDGSNLDGKSTPYAPKFLLNSALTFQNISGFGFRLTANYVGEQFADELNTVTPSPDGRNGIIPAFHTFDGNLFYSNERWNTTFTLSVKNLTNERYIANRRPQGIRVGLPRWINFGAEYRF